MNWGLNPQPPPGNSNTVHNAQTDRMLRTNGYGLGRGSRERAAVSALDFHLIHAYLYMVT